jgi:hypothetical protein
MFVGGNEILGVARVGTIGDRGGEGMDNGDTLPSPVPFVCDKSSELLLTVPKDSSVVSGSR